MLCFYGLMAIEENLKKVLHQSLKKVTLNYKDEF